MVSLWRVSVPPRATASVPGRRHYNNIGRGPAVWVQLSCLLIGDHVRIPRWLWGQSVSTWHVADVQATVSNPEDTLEIVHALGCFPFENMPSPQLALELRLLKRRED